MISDIISPRVTLAVQTRLDVVSSRDLGLNFFGISDISVLYTLIPDMEMFNFTLIVYSFTLIALR